MGVNRINAADVTHWTANEPEMQPSKIDGDSEEVTLFWYQSSIGPVQADSNSISEKVEDKKIELPNSSEQTLFQKFNSWLWGFFGSNAIPELAESQVQHSSALESLPRSPKLQSPELMNKDRLSKAIADLNRDLLYRQKETSEFETEMRRSNSKAMDRLILCHIISKSLGQKKLKEEAGLEAHERVLNLQKANKDLHQKNYRLIDDLNATAKTNGILHWINVGTTGGIVAALAIGFATGGASLAYAIALPALNILKGGLSGAEGVLKYKNDLRTGEITMLTHQVKENRSNINEQTNTKLPSLDEEMSHLLKAIRNHLDNYYKEARVNLQS